MDDVVSAIASLPTTHDRKVIYICGLGGAGKTEFSNALQERLGKNCVTIRHDWYLTYPTLVRKERMQRAVASQDPQQIKAEENPVNWLSNDAFVEDIKQLRDNGKLELENIWNQKTGNRDLSLNLVTEKGGVILVDGIYLLHQPISQLADLRILLQISPEVARQRAEQRDSYRTDPEYLAHKARLMQKYDLPYFETYKANVDLIIDNSDYADPKIVVN